ncbi:MAG: T9SS type A sorting domain-containing protein [Bacteroidota bacterium]|nr:T9SS type A sorting domain-containing protein [Bacteroidota bacterium]
MGLFLKILVIFLFLLLFLLLHIFNSHILFSQFVSDFKVNDDTTNQAQYSAELSINSTGIFTVVWIDYRNGEGNIYAQRIQKNGMFIGNNFKININPDSSYSPNIAVCKNGNFGVCWMESNGTINFSSRVKFRSFDSNAQPITNEIVINDTNGNFYGPLSIGVNNSNEFIITWSHGNILYQRVNINGNKIGNNIRVNDTSNFYYHRHPEISIRYDESFIITWDDSRPPAVTNGDDIYFQMYDKFGNKDGVNEKVNDDFGPLNLQLSPNISSDSSGNFVIAWSDDRLDNTHSEVYAQSFNYNGIKIGPNFRVTQSTTSWGKGICNVFEKPNGEFLIGWSEFRPFIPKPYFQRYNTERIRIGNNYLVTNEFPSTDKFYSDVEIYEDKIISVWSDERNGPFDVYCNIRSFTNPDTTVNIIQTSSLIPTEFLLYQNYPNPFNSSTIIQFDIISNDNYNLDLYNTLGQKVKTIFDKNLSSGSYKINFVSENLNSGIYYYILSSPNEKLIKNLMLIK